MTENVLSSVIEFEEDLALHHARRYPRRRRADEGRRGGCAHIRRKRGLRRLRRALLLGRIYADYLDYGINPNGEQLCSPFSVLNPSKNFTKLLEKSLRICYTYTVCAK